MNKPKDLPQNIYQTKVRIFYRTTNAMQSTKNDFEIKWRIQFLQSSVFKNRSMGWVFTDDIRAFFDLNYDSLETAIQAAKEMGFSYEVVYPKQRKFEYKSYADNFVWKGPPSKED